MQIQFLWEAMFMFDEYYKDFLPFNNRKIYLTGGIFGGAQLRIQLENYGYSKLNVSVNSPIFKSI